MKDRFQFKQFTVRHDRCAMKVGTDGVLLGAWGAVSAPRILDIGTGTGLIALMAAQRQPDAQVLGIDIDSEAVAQARENVAASPFADRICIRHQSLQELASFKFYPELVEGQDSSFKFYPELIEGQPSTLNSKTSTLNSKPSALNSKPSTLNSKPSTLNSKLSTLNSKPSTLNPQLSTFNFQLSTFSSILCNPPFFEETLLPPDARRSQARHTPTLPFAVLIDAASLLLLPGGTFSVILPTAAFDDFRLRCFADKLICTRLCYVQTTPAKAPKRVLATFQKHPTATPLPTSEPSSEPSSKPSSKPTSEPSSMPSSEPSSMPAQCDGPTTLTLNHGTARSPEYAALTRDFYLW